MRFTIEISDEEIIEQAKQIAAEKLARQIRDDYYEGRVLRKMAKEVMREAIRENMDILADRAVSAAAKSIENRAVKKLLDKLQEDNNE